MAKGIYTNTELIESVIVDFNNLLKELFSGQYIQACCYITQISKKLINLRNTIDNDLKNRDENIEVLKNRLRAAGVEVVEIPAGELVNKSEKGGEKDGCD